MTSSISDSAVLQKWRIADSSTESLVRRLKWLQNMSANAKLNVQLLAAYFGKARCDELITVTAEGRLTEYANPWAR